MTTFLRVKLSGRIFKSAFAIGTTLVFTGVVVRSAYAAPTPTATPTETKQDAMVERERSRFEELFIENIAKELKLSASVEPSFIKALRRLNREKAQANDDVAAALIALEQAQNESRSASSPVSESGSTGANSKSFVRTKSGRLLKNRKVTKVATVKSETEKALRRYEKAMAMYSALPMLELSRLRKILGVEKLGLYLIAKSQMAEKLKALSARDVPVKVASPAVVPSVASTPAAASSP